ncbi:MAG: GrpB family protein [Sphingopyxis sp.]
MTLAIPVKLVEHDLRWATRAGDYTRLLAPLADMLVAVHHIGSTAVPGLISKPVIDLMPIAVNLEALDARRGDVEALGLRWNGEFGVDGRRFCTLDNALGQRLANVHFYAQGSPHARRHLALRDYLRSHPHVAAAYAVEKRRAQAIHPDDSVAYSAEKGAWIRATLERALACYDDGGDTR